MTAFGGLGGVAGGRGRDNGDLFEAAVERCFGEQLRAEGHARVPWYQGTGIGHRLWGSLANVDWRHTNGDTAEYSFRAAGDMIAAVVGAGDYMDWYCSHPYGEADDEIAERLAAEGWRPVPDEEAEAPR